MMSVYRHKNALRLKQRETIRCYVKSVSKEVNMHKKRLTRFVQKKSFLHFLKNHLHFFHNLVFFFYSPRDVKRSTTRF